LDQAGKGRYDYKVIEPLLVQLRGGPGLSRLKAVSMRPNAAVGGVAGGGVFSGIYSASFTRRKAERELLAGKLETPYSELKSNSRKR
jgi:hypothetical protein